MKVELGSQKLPPNIIQWNTNISNLLLLCALTIDLSILIINHAA